MIYATNTYPSVNSANTATPKRNKKMLQNTSGALYCSTAVMRRRETGLGFLFWILLNEDEGLEVSATPTPCGWRDTKESHNYSTGPELRFGAHRRSATENARAFSRLFNHCVL